MKSLPKSIATSPARNMRTRWPLRAKPGCIASTSGVRGYGCCGIETERTDQRPHDDGAGVDKAAQRHLEQEGKQQYQEELAKTQESIVACKREDHDADSRNGRVRQRNRASEQFSKHKVDDAPNDPRRDEHEAAEHQKRLLQAQVVAVGGIRADASGEPEQVLKSGEPFHPSSSSCAFAKSHAAPISAKTASARSRWVRPPNRRPISRWASPASCR